jgi:hypothetical protein
VRPLLPLQPVEVPFEFGRYLLEVHEVAEASPGALPRVVLPAARLAEVSHGAELGCELLACVETPLQCSHGCLRVLFLHKLDVDVAHHVVPKVVTYIDLINLPELGELGENVLVKGLELLLDLALVELGHLLWGEADVGVCIEVGEEEGLGEGWAVVDP